MSHAKRMRKEAMERRWKKRTWNAIVEYNRVQIRKAYELERACPLPKEKE